MPGTRVFLHPVTGHLFAEAGHPDHAAASAELAAQRVLAFLAALP